MEWFLEWKPRIKVLWASMSYSDHYRAHAKLDINKINKYTCTHAIMTYHKLLSLYISLPSWLICDVSSKGQNYFSEIWKYKILCLISTWILSIFAYHDDDTIPLYWWVRLIDGGATVDAKHGDYHYHHHHHNHHHHHHHHHLIIIIIIMMIL